MGLTRDFKETVVARARSDAKFRDAMFAEAINATGGVRVYRLSLPRLFERMESDPISHRFRK